MSILPRPLTAGRDPLSAALVSLGALGMITAVIYWLGMCLAQERYRELVVAAVLAQVLWVPLRWQTSVYIFMVYVVLEGFLINFFSTVPELNLLKDVFAIALFAALAANLAGRGISPLPRRTWLIPFAGFSIVYVLQVFNPALPNLLVGLVGIRATLLYFVLVPVGFWFFDSRARVERFFSFLVWFSAPVALFGIAQYFLGPEWMISLSPGFSRAVYYAFGASGSGESLYFRTFSTFVHTGGFGQYLILMLLLTIALWNLQRSPQERIWLAAIFLVQFFALLTTGSRTSLVIFVAGIGMLALIHRRGAVRSIPLLVFGPLLLWASAFFVGPGFIERFRTVLDLEFVQNRNMPLLYGWLMDSMKSDWAGLGAGYASVASRHAGETPLNISVVENGLAKVRFESGLPGFALYLAFIVALMFECLRAPLLVGDARIRWLSTVCGVFLFLNVINVVMGTPFDASPTNTYIWFFLGFLARAPHIQDSSGQPR